MDQLDTTTDRQPVAKRRLADLPGPRSLPIIGNLHQVDRSAMHLSVEAWAREYGPFFRFRIGDRRFVGVADPEALSTLMRDRPAGVRRGAKLERIWIEMGLPVGVFVAEGEAWKRQRRMVMAGFDPAHVREYFPALQRVATRLQGRWSKAAAQGQAIPLQPDLMRFTVDAIAGLAFGAEVNTLESDTEVIQAHLDKIFPAIFNRVMAPLPIWRWIKRPADRQLDRSVAEVKQAIAGFIAQSRARLLAEPARRARPANLLDAMLVAAEANASGLGDADVAGNVLTMLLAGEDTTANTLSWMIYLLHRHPETLARARAEVLDAFGDRGELIHEGLGRLNYVEACAHETMRLKPVAPFLGLELQHDTVIGDVAVPRGTLVWAVMRHASLDEAHFADAGSFRPERWLGDGGPAHAASSAKRVSMPFGAGPRVCPGRYLALLEMKLCIAMLLQRFDILGIDTPDGAAAREQLQFTMSPVGLRMRLRERTAAG
ncbi:MAG: cytochrome P450 [Hydrogenophaga sp.]|nr:cytochrome P450 [Hydrogenophaga sp.]MDP3836018.1 cytochrome P450 [Hydrogenophaga sp.]